MARRTAAIVQSSYIPWKGYFDLINMVDEFVLFDDVQFTRRDWRNRNRIKTPQGVQWLSIPVEVKGQYHQSIKDTLVDDPSWGRQHWNTLRHNYARAAYFEHYADIFRDIYLNKSDPHLSQINHNFIAAVCQILAIKSRISWSMMPGALRANRLVGVAAMEMSLLPECPCHAESRPRQSVVRDQSAGWGMTRTLHVRVTPGNGRQKS